MILFPRNISQNIFSSLTRLTSNVQSVTQRTNSCPFSQTNFPFQQNTFIKCHFLPFFFFLQDFSFHSFKDKLPFSSTYLQVFCIIQQITYIKSCIFVHTYLKYFFFHLMHSETNCIPLLGGKIPSRIQTKLPECNFYHIFSHSFHSLTARLASFLERT